MAEVISVVIVIVIVLIESLIGLIIGSVVIIDFIESAFIITAVFESVFVWFALDLTS
jgi:hypothetical protein